MATDTDERSEVSEAPGEPHNALTHRFPVANLTVLSHFYRGELARSIAWRHKMDQTTHWAIISTTAIVSFSFSSNGVQHIALPFACLIIFLLLNIEGRRYRYFDVWRNRLRMLEVHFLVPAVAHDKPLPEGDWREVLCNDLFNPAYKISYWEAVGRRLRRNYIWLFVLILIAWAARVFLDRKTGESFYEACAVRSVADGHVMAPSWLVVSLGVTFYVFLLALTLFSSGIREGTGEIRRRDPNRKLWPI